MDTPVLIRSLFAVTGLVAGLSLSGCAAMSSMTDLSDTPEYAEQIKAAGGVPDTARAPEKPKDLRSDKEWDEAARKLIAKQGTFDALKDEPVPTDAEILAQREALRAKVNAYIADDPK